MLSSRHQHLANALAALAELAARDPTVSGATLILPGGEAIYLDADTVRRPAPAAGAKQ